jgi:hypothetical protein
MVEAGTSDAAMDFEGGMMETILQRPGAMREERRHRSIP